MLMQNRDENELLLMNTRVYEEIERLRKYKEERREDALDSK